MITYYLKQLQKEIKMDDISTENKNNKITQPPKSSLTGVLDFFGWVSIILGVLIMFWAIYFLLTSSISTAKIPGEYILAGGIGSMILGFISGAMMLVISENYKTSRRIEWMLIQNHNNN